MIHHTLSANEAHSSIGSGNQRVTLTVGFDQNVTEIQQLYQSNNWYSPRELDLMRSDFNRVVRRNNLGYKEMKGHPHRGTEGRNEQRKETISKSKQAVIQNQRNIGADELADIYRTCTEKSQDKALKLAVEDENFVKDMITEDSSPSKAKKSPLRTLFRVFKAIAPDMPE